MRRIPQAASVLVVMILSITAACASGGGAADASQSCRLRSSDTVFTRGGPVYRACGVERPAQRISDVAPAVARPNPRECYSAQIEFVVGPDGVPEAGTARTLKSSSTEFAHAVLATLPRWRYEPALLNGVPVRQIVTEEQGMQGVVAGARVVSAGGSPPAASSALPKC